MRTVYTPFAAWSNDMISLVVLIGFLVTILPVISNTVIVAWLLLLSDILNVPLLGLGYMCMSSSLVMLLMPVEAVWNVSQIHGETELIQRVRTQKS
jgi:uncharacterized membrane-anchored protein YitT (DUF2179 family)